MYPVPGSMIRKWIQRQRGFQFGRHIDTGGAQLLAYILNLCVRLLWYKPIIVIQWTNKCKNKMSRSRGEGWLFYVRILRKVVCEEFQCIENYFQVTWKTLTCRKADFLSMSYNRRTPKTYRCFCREHLRLMNIQPQMLVTLCEVQLLPCGADGPVSETNP